MSTPKFYEDLSKAQAKFCVAKKDSDNPFFKSKYASIQSLLSCCKDALAEFGFCILQPIVMEDGVLFVKTILAHKDGGEVISKFPLPPLNMNSKNPIQDQGKAITYYRRYAIQSMLNLSTDEDDDANFYSDTKNGCQTSSNEIINESQVKALISAYEKLDGKRQHIAYNALKNLKIDKFQNVPCNRYPGYMKLLENLLIQQKKDDFEKAQDGE